MKTKIKSNTIPGNSILKNSEASLDIIKTYSFTHPDIRSLSSMSQLLVKTIPGCFRNKTKEMHLLFETDSEVIAGCNNISFDYRISILQDKKNVHQFTVTIAAAANNILGSLCIFIIILRLKFWLLKTRYRI